MSDDDESPKRNGKRPPRGVFERPKGSGIWWVCYFDENRRKHREKVGPKALALKVYQKRKNEIQERRFFPERIRRRDVLVAAFIGQYLDTVKNKASYGNCEHYADLWKAALKGKTLRQVLPGDVERYKAQRVKDVAPATANRELAFLKRVLNVAIADGKADTNPVRVAGLFKENNQRRRYLTDEEEGRLREAIGESEWPKVAFALLTGFRQGNQLRLRWTDVNFDVGVVWASKPKGKKDYCVPMNDELRAILGSLPSRLRSEWVFPSETRATPIDARNYMNRVFTPALERAGIGSFRWHDLRHTFASRLVMKGVDLNTVRELMGHKSISMTQRYAHLSRGHKLEAVQKLNRPKTEAATDTATDTSEKIARKTVGGSAEVIEMLRKESAPGVIRTPDLQIRSLPL